MTKSLWIVLFLCFAVLTVPPAFGAPAGGKKRSAGNTVSTTPRSRPSSRPAYLQDKVLASLESQTRHRDRYRRLNAYRILAGWAPRSKKVVPLLTQGLGDPFLRIAMIAGDALRKYGLWVVPKLREALRDKRRLFAIGVICNIGPQALPLMKALFDKGPWRERLWIVQFLPRLYPHSVPMMTGALQDKTPLVRHEALILLGRRTQLTQVQKAKILAMMGDREPSIRRSSVEILLKHALRSPAFLRRLLALGALSSDVEKRWLLQQLRRFSGDVRPAYRWVRLVAGDENTSTRSEARKTLRVWRSRLSSQQRSLLKSLESHARWRTRLNAAKTLESLGSKASPVHYFLDRSLQDRLLIRVHILRTLEKIGPDAAPVLLRFLRKDKHWVLRQDAALILGRMGDKVSETEKGLKLASTNDPDPRVRASAIRSHGRVASLTTPPTRLWERMLRDKHLLVRLASIRASASWALRKKSVPTFLSRALAHPEKAVRDLARTSLAKIRVP